MAKAAQSEELRQAFETHHDETEGQIAWQIVPEAFFAMITDKDAIKSERAMRAMMQMKKLDLPALQRADEH